MNTLADTPVGLKQTDRSSAEISFTLVPQNPNDEGFLERFLTENVEVERVSWDKSDGVNEDGKGRLAARFKVVVAKREPAAPAKKSTAKKKVSPKTNAE